MPWTIETPLDNTTEFTQPTQILEESQQPEPTPFIATSERVIGKLIASRGGEPSKEFTLKLGQALVIGRHRSCDVILKGDFCSNLHCRISAKATLDGSEDFDVSCEDLSSNGTYLNRKKIGRGKTVLLSHGDTLEIHKGNYFTFLQTYRRPGQDALLHQDQEVVDAKYQITERILGTGTFAQVKLAICKTTGQRLAAKIIDRQRFGSISVKQRGTDFVQEINIMQSITHPNIVQVTDVIRTPKYLYIFMPLLTGGDLFEYIMHQERLPEAEVKFICFQILHALKYLHERNISHRDVKPENVLLKTNSPYAQVMLTDFGMARVVGKKSFMQTMCGTFQYIAPEVIAVNKSPEDTDESCQGYNKMVDCWSLGVLLYAALSGTLPFSSDDDNNTLLFREIQAGIVTFPSVYWGDISEEARSMVKSLLVVDPRRRATVHDALNHPWIQTDIETLQRLHHNCLLQSDPSRPVADGCTGISAAVIPSSPVTTFSPPPIFDAVIEGRALVTPAISADDSSPPSSTSPSSTVAAPPVKVGVGVVKKKPPQGPFQPRSTATTTTKTVTPVVKSVQHSPTRERPSRQRHHPYARPRSASNC